MFAKGFYEINKDSSQPQKDEHHYHTNTYKQINTPKQITI